MSHPQGDDVKRECLKQFRFARTSQVVEQAGPGLQAGPLDREALAKGLGSISSLLRDMNRPEEALLACREAHRHFEELVKEYPAFPHFRHDLAISHGVMGRLHANAGRLDQALADFQSQARLLETLIADNPDNEHYASSLWYCWDNHGTLHLRFDRREEALHYYEQGHDLAEQLAKKTPASVRNQLRLAESCRKMGLALRGLDRNAQAAEAFRRAAGLFARMSLATRGKENAEEALDCLHRAIACGLKDVRQLEKDPDLEPLRGLREFQRLLDTLPR